jgi:hypothetical protein
MGYVHDTQMAQVIHPSECLYTAGTWTDTVASNVWSKNRTAADATFVIQIPVKLPQNAAALKGAYLRSLDVWYTIGTAAMDAVSAALYKAGLPANAGSWSAAAVTTSYDTGHDTAAERYAVATHKLSLSLATPAWLDDDDCYYVELDCDAAASSVFKFYGARLNYTLRL